MRKLRLIIEDLSVTSFPTREDDEARSGTVLANGNIPVPYTQEYTCGPTYCMEHTCTCVDFSARTLCAITESSYCSPSGGSEV